MSFQKSVSSLRVHTSRLLRSAEKVFGKATIVLVIVALPFLLLLSLIEFMGTVFTALRELPEIKRRSELLRRLLEEGVVTSVNTWSYNPHGESAVVTTWEVEGRNNGERFVYSPEAQDYDEVRIGEIPSDVFRALNPYYALRIIEYTARGIGEVEHERIKVKMPIVVLKKGAIRRMIMIMRTDHRPTKTVA